MGGGQSTLYNDRFGTSFESHQWLSLYFYGLLGPCLVTSFFLFSLRTISTTIVLSGPTTSVIILYVGYASMTLLAWMSLVQAQWTDPGAVPLGARPLGISAPRRTNAGEKDNSTKNDTSTRTTTTDRLLELCTSGDEDDGKEAVSTNLKKRPAPLFVPTRASCTIMGEPNSTVCRNVAKSRAVQRGIMRCPHCGNNYRPAKALHDPITGRCIVKLNHYCLWIGNAVGIRNHKFFVLFHFYTFLSSFLSIVLLFLHFVQCLKTITDEFQEESEDLAMNSSNSSLVSTNPSWCDTIKIPSVIVLATLSVFLNVYTCIILIQQWDCIESNQSKIAKVRAVMGKKKRCRGDDEVNQDHVNELFGGMHPYPTWHWFLPTQIRFRSLKKLEAVLGYEFRPEWFGEVYNEEHHDNDLEEGVDNDGVREGGK